MIYASSLVSDYFLARASTDEDALTNLKVQKLCYYAAGLIAAVRGVGGDPLFREQIEAWQHGPVVPVEYRRFSQYIGNAIPASMNFDYEQIEPRDLAILNDVYGYYGQYSAWKLRNMTHDEDPWITAWNRDDKVISHEELRLFFEKEVGEEYISSYATSGQKQ